MHMGLDPYVIGETVTPNLEKGDIFIIGSGSGETKSLVAMAEKAKNIGGTIAAITIFPESTIGKLADITIQVPAQAKSKEDVGNKSIQPMGSLFEQSLLLIYDSVILRFMERKGVNSEIMYDMLIQNSSISCAKCKKSPESTISKLKTFCISKIS
jgi:6-phospho-3-hexuloisomerase